MMTLRAARPVRTLLIGACCVTAGLAWCGGGRPVDAAGSPATPGVEAAEAASRRHYDRFCARCHDDDLRGAMFRETTPRIPDLTNAAWQSSRNDAQVLAVILEGRGRMPSFRGKLSDDQAHGLVSLIRQAGPARAQPTEADPDDFARRFAELQKEFEALRQEFRRLSPPARKP